MNESTTLVPGGMSPGTGNAKATNKTHNSPPLAIKNTTFTLTLPLS